MWVWICQTALCVQQYLLVLFSLTFFWSKAAEGFVLQVGLTFFTTWTHVSDIFPLLQPPAFVFNLFHCNIICVQKQQSWMRYECLWNHELEKISARPDFHRGPIYTAGHSRCWSEWLGPNHHMSFYFLVCVVIFLFTCCTSGIKLNSYIFDSKIL